MKRKKEKLFLNFQVLRLKINDYKDITRKQLA